MNKMAVLFCIQVGFLKGYCHDNFVAFSSILWRVIYYDPEPLICSKQEHFCNHKRKDIKGFSEGGQTSVSFLEIFPTHNDKT